MFACESDLFEIEDNHIEFQELCSKLKNHTFPSPWSVFFHSNEDEFISEVSEFVDVNLTKEPTADTFAPLLVDLTSADISKESHSADVLVDKKKIYRLKDSLMSVQESSSVDCIKDFDVFFTVPSSQIQELFEMLDISIMSDTALNLFLNAFLHFKDEISVATAIALVHYVISPLILDLKNSCRFLSTTILKFAETYPKVIIDEILIPYTKKETSDNMQSEIISQIVKTNLPNEYVSHSLRRVLEHALPLDNTFAVVQCLIERKVYHESSLFDILLKKFVSWSSTCNKNVKFTKLITSLLSAHGNEFSDQQLSLCDNVVGNNKTIIKRAAENLLKKLKNPDFL